MQLHLKLYDGASIIPTAGRFHEDTITWSYLFVVGGKRQTTGKD